MINASPTAKCRIDAGIIWVDGADRAHLRKREHWLARSNAADGQANENGINPHRRAYHDGLHYRVRSVGNHAPWIERVWIVSDAQAPDLSALPADLRTKINVIDERTSFVGMNGRCRHSIHARDWIERAIRPQRCAA